MSPIVELISAGGFFKPLGATRRRSYVKGERAEVDDATAALLTAGPNPNAILVGSLEEEHDDSGDQAIMDGAPGSLKELKVLELRAFAKRKGIDLRGATSKGDIIDAIEEWLTKPVTGGDDDG